MKITLVSVESHSSNSRKNINLSWEDQTFYSNLVDIVNIYLLRSLKLKEYVEITE